MKVFVKTLKGKYFEIEVNREDKVANVKTKIEANQGGDVYPAAQQMLIHQGKVLEDEMTLSENKVAENSFIVIMLTKNKVSCSGVPIAAAAPTNQNKVSSSGSPIAAAAPTNQNKVSSSGASTAAAEPTSQNKVSSSGASTAAAAPTSQAQPASSSLPTLPHPPAPSEAPSSTMASMQFPEAPPTVAPPVFSESDVYGEAASNIVAGNNLEATIQQLLEMGGGSWGRDTVIQALRAAYNNPERAVDYLYSGIPDPAEILTIAQVQASGQAENPPAQAPHPAFPSSGPNSNPLVLFPQGLPDIGSNTSAGTLDFLRHSQQFQAFRAMVQTNPQILQELGKQNPNLMRLIQEHQADFLRLINEPIEVEGDLPGDLAAAMPQSVTVTLEEREAIERLESMGFGKALVLEVFFACNKNEELAANYLLDHIHEFEE